MCGDFEKVAVEAVSLIESVSMDHLNTWKGHIKIQLRSYAYIRLAKSGKCSFIKKKKSRIIEIAFCFYG